jgi:hypothetical protein
MPGAPSRYGVNAWALRMIVPRLGQHNEDIFVNELGLTTAGSAFNLNSTT